MTRERRAMAIGIVLGVGAAGLAGTLMGMGQPGARPGRPGEPREPRPEWALDPPNVHHVSQSAGGGRVYLWRIDRQAGTIEFVDSASAPRPEAPDGRRSP